MELPATSIAENPDDLHELVNTENELDIRWQIVCDHIRANTKPSTRQDKYVWAAYKYRVAAMNVNTLVGRQKLCKKHSIVAEAIEYFRDGQRLKPFMEALCLCPDLELEVQAIYMGISPEVIIMYEKLFFDMRAKRNMKGWIMSKVLQATMAQSFDDACNPIIAWKIIAVHGGFKILKSCFCYGEANEEAVNFHMTAGLNALAMKFGMANFTRPVNNYSAGEITEQMTRLEELKHRKEHDAKELQRGKVVEEGILDRILENTRPFIKSIDAPLIGREPRVLLTEKIGD